jgi:glucan phosphoethanolaminetransferase (alkaline phosphatase superfamily)
VKKGWWKSALGRLFRSWRWSGAFFLVLCLTNVPSLLQKDLFDGASLALLPRLGLLAEEAVRVAGLSLLLTLVCGFFPRFVRRVLAAASLLFFLVDIFTLRQYHSVLDAGLLEVVVATNPAEATEYVTSQAGVLAPFLVGGTIAVALVCWRRPVLSVCRRGLPRAVRQRARRLADAFLPAIRGKRAEKDGTCAGG